MPNKYTNLFSPIKIGGVEVKNRFAMMPMGVFSPRLMNRRTGAYTKDGADYYIERAKGGTGLIITGLIPVVPLPVMNPVNHPEDYVSEMQYLTNGIHEYGAKIFVQLTALTGRSTPGETEDDLKLTPAPAPIQNVWDPTLQNRGMTKDEIRQYIKNFAQAASLSQQAGADGVEIHAVHEGYLLDQFVISNFNRRKDEYGGSLDNRLRFPIEIVQAIKEKCGDDFPVSLRYSAKSYTRGFNRGALPGVPFAEFGRDMEESRIIARRFQEAGYDMLNCDNGSYDAWYWAHPPMYMPKACNLEDVAQIKKEVDIPVVCAGRFDLPDLAEEAIGGGRIDMMGLGRPLLADPEFANKVAAGELEEIRPCIACHQGCLGRIFQGGDISCAVNPQCGREKSLKLERAMVKKKVVVVGGGLGGMEAARVSALRGHTVDLYEKADVLGGVFVPASTPDFKDDDKRLLQWYVRQMDMLGVNIHMESEVTKEALEKLTYDELFIATGAIERHLDIPGLDEGNTTYAVQAFLQGDVDGENVIIIGGGLTGCELAYMLARKGKKVTIVEEGETILNVQGLSAANYNMLMELLEHYKVQVYKNAEVESFKDGKALVKETIKNFPNSANRAKIMTAVGPQGMPKNHKLAADHFVVSVGYISDDALYKEMEASNVHLLGDARKPANVMDTVWSANTSARDV